MAKVRKREQPRPERQESAVVRRLTVARACAGCGVRFDPADYPGPWCDDCLADRR